MWEGECLFPCIKCLRLGESQEGELQGQMEGRLVLTDAAAGTSVPCTVVLERAPALLRVMPEDGSAPLALTLETLSATSGLPMPAASLTQESDVAFTLEAPASTAPDAAVLRLSFTACDPAEAARWVAALTEHTRPAAPPEAAWEWCIPADSGATEDDTSDAGLAQAVRAVAFQASGMDEYLCGLAPEARTPPPSPPSPRAPSAGTWHARPSTLTPRTPRGAPSSTASIGGARRAHSVCVVPKEGGSLASSDNSSSAGTPVDNEEEGGEGGRAPPALSLSGRVSSCLTRLIDRRHRTTGSTSAAQTTQRRAVCVVPPVPSSAASTAVAAAATEVFAPSEDDSVPECDVFPGVVLPRGAVLRILGCLGPCDLAQCARVSRAWHRLCNTPRLWERFAHDLGLCTSPLPMPEYASSSTSAQVPQSKLMVAEFRERGAQSSRRRLWDALYRPLLQQTLVETTGAEGGNGSNGMAWWLSVRGENLLAKWKKRWAVISHNCLLLYRNQRPNERPRLLVPLRGDLRVESVKRGTVKLSSVNGVLLTLALKDANTQQHSHQEEPQQQQQHNGTLVEKSRGFLYLSVDKGGPGRGWLGALGRSVALSRQLFGVPPRGAQRVRLFGVPLEAVMAQQRAALGVRAPRVPLFVAEIVAHLRATALDEEGLFRVSGSAESAVRLRHRLEDGADVDYAREEPHTLTAVVKMFLRELPAPLVPQEVNGLLHAALTRGTGLRLRAGAGAAQAADLVRLCLADLPRDSTALLCCLARFLADVAAHADRNRMDQNNLLIVLVPTLRIAPSLLAFVMDHPAEAFGDP